jgi:hypothetical protein
MAVVAPRCHTEIVWQQDAGERGIKFVSVFCDGTIAQMESSDQWRSPPQATERLACFIATHSWEIQRGRDARVRMRSLTVCHANHLDGHTLRQGGLDESAGAEDFIVGVR